MKLGFFMIGFFHTKTTVSYTHIVELVADKDKKIALTLINAYDCSILLVVGMFYQFYEANTDKLLHFQFIVGAICCTLYMLVAPESPQWLILKKGSNSQQAIAILNYIARFNGSAYRIPKDTHFTIGSKNTEKTESFVEDSDPKMKSDDKFSECLEEIKLLFGKKDLRKMHWKMCVMFVCVTNL